MKRLISLQEEQLKVNSALLKWLESGGIQPVPNPSELLERFVQNQADFGRMGTDSSHSSQAVPNNISIEIGEKSTISPKLDFAIQWLKQNPDDKQKSGRELEASVLMAGERISYKWWNKAKGL